MQLDQNKLAYTLPEAAAAIGMGQSTLWAYAKKPPTEVHHLKLIRIGGRTLVRAEDLRAWIDSFEQRTEA